MKKKQLIGIFLLLAVLGTALFLLLNHQTLAGTQQKILPLLTAQIFKVGKADAIVLQLEEKVIILDAGEEEDGREIAEYLKKRNLNRVDAMIITHFDKDHVGGADTVLEELTVEKLILPDYEGSSTDYQEMMEALASSKKKNGTQEIRLREDWEMSWGKADILIEPPSSYEIPDASREYDNDFSLITTLRYGETTLLFMGDAEKRLTRSWLAKNRDRHCDFVKMPHHGVYQTALVEMLEALRPSSAALCTSQKNPAETKTVELLKAYRVAVYETRTGDITVSSDGTAVSVKQGGS